MTDIFTTAKRSRIMAAIRGRGNRTTELRLAALFRAARIGGWRRHLPLPGTPDFAFPIERVCVFVHGCFWHGCLKCRKMPKQNAAFWKKKIEGNRARDFRTYALLRRKGYHV